MVSLDMKKIIIIIAGLIIVIIVFFSFILFMNTNYEVALLSATVIRTKVTEREAGATADGMVGGGTYYYIYVEFDDKSQTKFMINEQLYNEYPTGSKADITVKQPRGNIFNSAEEKANPENYSYFIDDTEIKYSYTMIDDVIIERSE